MNITIGTGNVNTWRRFKAQYVAAVCGLALAVSALMVSSPWQQDSARPTPSAVASNVPASQPSQPEGFVYYLMGSQQEAAVMQSLLSTESAAWLQPGAVAHTLVMDTPKAQMLAGKAQRELSQHGVSVRVIDLR